MTLPNAAFFDGYNTAAACERLENFQHVRSFNFLERRISQEHHPKPERLLQEVPGHVRTGMSLSFVLLNFCFGL